MNKRALTNQDYFEAAKFLNCEVAALQAVADVESDGDGYDQYGRLKVRFEGHKFREYTGGKYDRTHQHLSYSYKNRHGKAHGYTAFNEAFALDQEAALKASSFGKFQPLAVNYREAGFRSVRAFVDFLRESERNQLIVFCRMVKFRHLDDELRRLDWAGFAKNYNGASFRDNDYDGKMARRYAHHKRFPIKSEFNDLRDDEIDNLFAAQKDEPAAPQIGKPSVVLASNPAQSPQPSEDASQSQTSDAPAQAQTVQQSSAIDKAREMSEIFGQKFDHINELASQLNTRKDSAKSLWTMISQILYQSFWALVAFAIGLPREVWLVVAVIVGVLALFYLHRQLSLGKMRELARLKLIEIADRLK